MNITNTENSNMENLKKAGWQFFSMNVPEVIIVPPSSFYYELPQINTIETEVHESLLNKSLIIHDEIWTILARM